LQLEYSSKCINKSNIALGIKCNDGLIIFKEIDSNQYNNDIIECNMIFCLNHYMAMTSSGITGDFRSLCNRLVDENLIEKYRYGLELNSKYLTHLLSRLFHLNSNSWSLRPLACDIILGFIDYSSLEIFFISNQGSIIKTNNISTGSACELINFELESIFKEELSCRKVILKIIKKLSALTRDLQSKYFYVKYFAKKKKKFTDTVSFNFIKEIERYKLYQL